MAKGRSIHLKSGAKVAFFPTVADGSGGFKFTSADGVETRLKLSYPAIEAVRDLTKSFRRADVVGEWVVAVTPTPTDPGAVISSEDEEPPPEIHVAYSGPTEVDTTVCPDPVTEALRAELLARAARGKAKYGQTVSDNPLPLKEWLQHALEEALDLAVYLRRAMDELPSDA